MTAVLFQERPDLAFCLGDGAGHDAEQLGEDALRHAEAWRSMVTRICSARVSAGGYPPAGLRLAGRRGRCTVRLRAGPGTG